MKLHATLVAAWLPLAAGCTTEAARPEKAPIPVRVATIEPVAVVHELRYAASIVPVEQVPLAFKSSGYVEALLQVADARGGSHSVQQGDRVTAGTVLARVQKDDFQANVQLAAARVAESDAALAKTRADLGRAERLFAVDSLTRSDLEAARLAYESAEARLEGARAGAELARTALVDTALRAPFTGIVLERRVERGSLVAPGSVAFVLADVRFVKAVFGVPDSVVQALQPGASLDVTTDVLKDRTFTGRVTAVSPAANPQSRVFDVDLRLANPDAALKPGMIAVVHLDGAAAARAQTVTTVPLTSIVKNDPARGGYAVLVVERAGDSDVAHARPVQLGDVVGNAIQVTDGVRPGERVITSGTTLVKDDDIVRVIP